MSTTGKFIYRARQNPNFPDFEYSANRSAVHLPMMRRIRYLIEVLDMNDAPVTPGSKERLADLDALWAERRRALTAISNGEINAINDALHVPLP